MYSEKEEEKEAYIVSTSSRMF